MLRDGGSGVSGSDRTKSGPTPKRPGRSRPVSRGDLSGFVTGSQWKPSRRCLDDAALWSALVRLVSVADEDDNGIPNEASAILQAIASETDPVKLAARYDVLAARNPDDARWEPWRARRRWEASRAN